MFVNRDRIAWVAMKGCFRHREAMGCVFMHLICKLWGCAVQIVGVYTLKVAPASVFVTLKNSNAFDDNGAALFVISGNF